MPTKFSKTKVVELYKCDICNKEHISEVSAKICEINHKCDHIDVFYDISMNERYDEISIDEICEKCSTIIKTWDIDIKNPDFKEVLINYIKNTYKKNK